MIRQRVVISREVLQALSPEQLDVALAHERSHRRWHDNLKRLLLLLAPDVLPCFRGFAALERGWGRFSEWAADDGAIGQDRRRSLSLATALVRVARMGVAFRPSVLTTCLVASESDLSARVDRLLSPRREWEQPLGGIYPLAAPTAILITAFLAAVMVRPATFYSVHELLEHLIHLFI
jgi:beta-lactamase regulating signal transducer with metallopeptidase domain